MQRPASNLYRVSRFPALRKELNRGFCGIILFVCLHFMSNQSLFASANAGFSIDKTPFGHTQDGQAVDLYTLKNSKGITVKVINYGAIIYSVEVPDRQGYVSNITAN